MDYYLVIGLDDGTTVEYAPKTWDDWSIEKSYVTVYCPKYDDCYFLNHIMWIRHAKDIESLFD